MDNFNHTSPERSLNYHTARTNMIETEHTHSPTTSVLSHMRPTKAFLNSIHKSNRAKFTQENQIIF